MTNIRANRIGEWLDKRGYTLRRLHDILSEQGVVIDYANLSSIKNHKRPMPKKYQQGLARALKINSSQLFHEYYSGMEDEFARWQAPQGHLLASVNQDDTKYPAQIYKNILDEKEIYPGDVLIFDLSPKAIAALQDGDIVMAQIYDDFSPQTTKTVIRQYHSPNLLVTNSAITPNKITHIQLDNAQIKAVMSDLFRAKK